MIEKLFKINYQYPTNNIVTELKVAGSKIAFIYELYCQTRGTGRLCYMSLMVS